MLRPERLALQGEGPLVEGLGLGEVALVAVERRQIDEAGRDLGMLGPEDLLADRLGAVEQGLGLREAALPVETWSLTRTILTRSKANG